MPSGFCTPLSPAIGLRHSIRYDEHMDIPMHSPPPDINVNTQWKDPIIPQHRFRGREEVGLSLFVFLTPIVGTVHDLAIHCKVALIM